MKAIIKELPTGIVTSQTMNENGVIEIDVTERKSYVTETLTRMFTNFYQLN